MWGLDNKKSFIGCLLKPEHYSPDFERTHIARNEELQKAVALSLEIQEKVLPLDLLIRLENIHNGYAVTRWEIEFKEAAGLWGLPYTLPLNFGV